MPTSLVTGGAGFIGSHVAQEVLDLGHKVIVLDDLSGGFTSNTPKSAKFIHGSILDHDLLSELFKEHQFDYVYHLGAYAAEGLSHFIKRYNYQNNVIGSINLINESVKHNIKCFVFTSSIAVYGSQIPPMSEDMIPQPEDPYGIAKYSIEQELKVTKEQFGLNYVIFRPHNVYGERQNIGDKYRNVIGIFMNQIMRNQPLTIFGNGKQTRAFSYIKDVAPYIARSTKNIDTWNQIFNIGSDENYTLNHLAKEVGRAMNSKFTIKYLKERNEVLHAHSSHEKFKKFFSPSKETSLYEGLNRMAKWALKSGPMKSSEFSNIEIEKGLPEGW
ncbi:NAD-dependent epimerase/dehydratase family protein [Reichenbachiella versicolor]|uniref:NAD-dependent epimerase/dehydratase family protein n=1 Tax=Reichenbachiella versicolor TaxID=1821036 RepID=UPI000D6E7D4A|nr:NAD-dependent epimerase/dehydratase family protein [Reichenbachiella versicolor]